VLLADISGSMEPYARAYLHLLHGAVRATRAEHQQSLLRQEAQQSAIRAEEEAKRAEENAKEAETQRQQAEALAEENRINLYAARIKLIAQTIDEGDVHHAQELLESLRPREGQEDLPSFDWFYLHQLASSERSTLSRRIRLGLRQS